MINGIIVENLKMYIVHFYFIENFQTRQIQSIYIVYLQFIENLKTRQIQPKYKHTNEPI